MAKLNSVCYCTPHHISGLCFATRFFLQWASLPDSGYIYSTSRGTAKIYCSHSIPNYNQILWYKQSEKQLLFLGHLYYKDGYPEAGPDGKMEGSADKERGSTWTAEQCTSVLQSTTYDWSSSSDNGITTAHSPLTPATIILTNVGPLTYEDILTYVVLC